MKSTRLTRKGIRALGDFIRLRHGSPPWEGSGRPSDHIETYHFHDIPLIGLIRRDGVNYLFKCLAGEIEPLHLWSYTLIEPWEIERLERAATVDEFDEVVAEVTSRAGVAAVALDRFGIVGSVHVEDWSTSSDHFERLFEQVSALEARLQADLVAQRSRLVSTV